MNNRQRITTVFVLALSLIVAGCGAGQSTSAPSSQLANPASENCIKQGGKLTIEKRGDGGEFGVCWFQDALQCEEWALMNGDCEVGGRKVTGYGPEGRYCSITGGEYTMTNSDITKEQGTCTFKNGTQCDGAEYWNGSCDSKSSAPAANTTPVTIDDLYPMTITWMDNLKTCTPYSRSYLHPLLAVQQTDTITGMDGDLCVVSQETAGRFRFECRYTADGIKTMTQDSFYQDAKNKTMSATGNDVSDVMSQQCIVTVLSTPTAP
jgi:putative hemolysin